MSISRRNFLKRTLASSIGLSSSTALISNLAMIKAATAQTSSRFADYKALVCVFLHGGNDSFNMLVPTESGYYAKYQAIRQSLAYDMNQSLPINPLSSQPYQLALAPPLAALQPLFQSGKLAFLANCGTLKFPTNKADISANPAILPDQLFSHNSQQNLWQNTQDSISSASGWAGRMADLLMDSPTQLSMNLSLEGNNLWQTGIKSVPYSIDKDGVETMAALDPSHEWNQPRVTAFEQLRGLSQHKLAIGFNEILTRTTTNIALVSNALAQIPKTQVSYPKTSLAKQLKMVGNLIAARTQLAQNRQIFFVSIGGFDTHDNQVNAHPKQLTKVAEALVAFQNHLAELQLENQVTTFTMSDFGRTLTSNGDGTDHGWGGIQMILGGAVHGGDIYGAMPQDIVIDGEDDFGDGRMIPTTSVEQYAATLASWFGLSANELNAVFPNLSRFNTANLGFI